MRYLLDTHALIWFQDGNSAFSATALRAIKNTSNEIFFSQVSLFEIAIKQKIGKLPAFLATVTDVYEQGLKDKMFFLPLQNQQLQTYAQVPLKQDHRDPFDRLLIATAIVENLAVITVDKNFVLYNDIINVVW